MLSADLLTLWSQAGLVTPGTDAFVGSRALVPPTGDGPFTAVTDTGGFAPSYSHSEATPWLHQPTAQVTVRARTIEAAFALAQALYAALVTVTNRTVNGAFYLAMRALQPPFDRGQDTVGRCTVAFNVLGWARG